MYTSDNSTEDSEFEEEFWKTKDELGRKRKRQLPGPLKDFETEISGETETVAEKKKKKGNEL